MKRLSEARISHLAHKLFGELKKGDTKLLSSDRLLLTELKRLLNDSLNKDDALDVLVRRKIASLSRHVEPGSREYDVIYRSYYDEEKRRRR